MLWFNQTNPALWQATNFRDETKFPLQCQGQADQDMCQGEEIDLKNEEGDK